MGPDRPGANRAIEEVTVYPATPAGFEQVKGFGFPIRFRIDASDDADFQKRETIADQSREDYASPGDEPRTFRPNSVCGRYVRVTATKLWNRASGPEPFCFALGELKVSSGGVNVALRAPVRARIALSILVGA